jgi:hypothetical protein
VLLGGMFAKMAKFGILEINEIRDTEAAIHMGIENGNEMKLEN